MPWIPQLAGVAPEPTGRHREYPYVVLIFPRSPVHRPDRGSRHHDAYNFDKDPHGHPRRDGSKYTTCIHCRKPIYANTHVCDPREAYDKSFMDLEEENCPASPKIKKESKKPMNKVYQYPEFPDASDSPLPVPDKYVRGKGKGKARNDPEYSMEDIFTPRGSQEISRRPRSSHDLSRAPRRRGSYRERGGRGTRD